MLKFGKTLSWIGSFFLISSSVPLMCLSVFMVSIRRIVVSSLRNIQYIGEWLASLADETLKYFEIFGGVLFVIVISIIIIVILHLVFINFRTSFKQRIGYFIGIVFGGLLLFASAIPYFITLSPSIDGLWNLITGLLFTFCGLSGFLITIGSFFGMLSAKTEKSNSISKRKTNKLEKKFKYDPAL
ncbi:hypothetical protein SCORR_v1c07680 [Spiroplasma corruscae]|uniref:Transmembrane protein n=1 Tax=Spiroplasma corruscae TaxID=216934 RepID=A0A222EPT2_9MOLU|nr:hypothetical protein [Spiroplasma corruscae]ASP28540.1 hypothetical protein SCORR_v1c07680 [Spiroplasma corruscae]